METTASQRMTPAVNPLSKIDEDLAHEREGLGGEQEADKFNYAKLFEPTQGPKPPVVNKFLDGFNRIFRPYARAPEAAQVIGEQLARERLNNEQALEALKSGRGRYSLKTPEGLQFADDIESGKANAVPVVQALRQAHDEAWQRVVEERPDAARYYIKNYLGRLFKNPDAAETTLVRLGQQKASLGGRGSFLYKRAVPTMKEAIAAGLEPVSDDLFDMQLMKIREMNRYVAASKYIKELNRRGFGRFIGVGDDVPPGYLYVDDRVAGVDAASGARTKARFIAQEPVARLLNNHLAPGFQGNPIFDAYRSVGNTLNMWQLGYSMFHVMTTSLESSISEVANGLRQGLRGDFGALAKSVATAPIAPFKYFTEGSKVLREALHPGTMGAPIAEWVERVLKGGGNFRMDEFYRTGGPEAFMKALRQRSVLGAGKSVLPALAEWGSTPVMKWYVPRLKLGAFMSIAKEELARLPQDATPEMENMAMTKAMASVDNRFGQLAYDNLFWHKALKDLSFVAVRSVGWNLGTIREILGGVADAGRLRNTAKASYVVALPVTVGLVGGILHYLMTGEQPQDYKDFYYPRTGNFKEDGSPERVQLPSYMRDVFNYSQEPFKTIANKAHPEIKTILDMLDNKDFQGQEIRNPNDPLVKQVLEEAQFVASQFEPISMRNVASEQGPSGQALTALGVTPAPRRVTQGDLTSERERVKFGSASPQTIEAREALDKDRRQLALLGSNVRKIKGNKNIPQAEKDRLANQIEARRASIVADLRKRSQRLVDLMNTGKP